MNATIFVFFVPRGVEESVYHTHTSFDQHFINIRLTQTMQMFM